MVWKRSEISCASVSADGIQQSDYVPGLSFGRSADDFNDIGSDTWQQYIMNYTAIVNDIRDGSFSLWDFPMDWE